MCNSHLWRNKETDVLLTYAEMIEQAQEQYGIEDVGNVEIISKYFEDTGEEIPDDWYDDDCDITDDDEGFDPYEGCYIGDY